MDNKGNKEDGTVEPIINLFAPKPEVSQPETPGERFARTAIEHDLVKISQADLQLFKSNPDRFDPLSQRVIAQFIKQYGDRV